VSNHLSPDELTQLGFPSVGSNVRIDRRAAIFGASNITLGSNVRIDCFTMLAAGSAPVVIGDYVHVAMGCYVSGGAGGITMGHFSGLAPKVAIHAESDDYRDGHLTNGTVPHDLAKTAIAPVHLGDHVIVGSGSVILPGVTVGWGAAIGALTMVHKDIPELGITLGNPPRVVDRRNGDRLRELEAEVRRRDGATS